MLVDVGHADLPVTAATVGGAPELAIDDEDGVWIARVGEDVAEVPGADQKVAVAGQPGPGRATIIGSVDAALHPIDERPDSPGAHR